MPSSAAAPTWSDDRQTWPFLTAESIERIERDAAVLLTPQIAGYLQDRLQQSVAGFLAGLANVKQFGRYTRGATAPRPEVDRRIREGYKVVRMIEEVYSAQAAKAWLFGTNSRLDDRAPISVLRDGSDDRDFAPVLAAARGFASPPA